MAVTDTGISDWLDDYGAGDTNTPAGTDFIAQELDDQLRNIKSVVRAESVNKSWEVWAGKYGTLAFVSGTQFSLTGDQHTSNGGPAEVGRRVRLIHSSSAPAHGIVTDVSVSGNTTVTVRVDDGDTMAADLSEVQFGLLNKARTQNAWRQDTTPLRAVATGTNSYAVTLSPAPTALTVGQVYIVQFSNANTGPVTLNINGLGAADVDKNGTHLLEPGDIAANSALALQYTGSRFIVLSLPSVPTGGMTRFGGASAPEGWLECDGSTVSRTGFAALFAVIGTTYGAGNGSTTFNLPTLSPLVGIYIIKD